MQSTEETIIHRDDVKPFGMVDKVGYAFGDLGTTALMGAMSASGVFATNVLGIPVAISATIQTITTFWGAFTDFSIGRAADTRKLGKKGRFHPWIKAFNLIWPISVLLMYLPIIKNLPLMARIAWFVAGSFITVLTLSGFNIPYGSLASAMSDNPSDRTSLSVFRNIGSAIGAGGAGYIVPMFIYTTAADNTQQVSGERIFIIMVICAIISIILHMFMYNMTTERVVTEKKENIKLSNITLSLFKNKALVGFFFVEVMVILSTSMISYTNQFLFTVYFRSKQGLALALLFGYANTLLLSPVARKLTEKYGKKEVCSIALVLSSALYFVMYFLRLNSVVTFLILMFLAALCFSMFNIIVWAFMTDITDYQEYTTGMREEGTVYSFNMVGRKIGQALSPALSGFALSAIGYVSTTSGSMAQSASVQRGMYTLATLAPAVLLLLGAIFLFTLYPLTKKKLDHVEATLREKSEKKAE